MNYGEMLTYGEMFWGAGHLGGGERRVFELALNLSSARALQKTANLLDSNKEDSIPLFCGENFSRTWILKREIRR